MSVYLVAYELDEDNLDNQDYDDLFDAIEEYDGCCQVFDNVWFVYSDASAEEIHEDLVQHLYDGDYILIMEAGEDYHGWLSDDVVDWLNENL